MEPQEEFPESYYCPISGELMRDPVMDKEGNTYEKEVILAWLSKSKTSPMTREPLVESDLRPNRALKDCIDLIRGKAAQKIKPAIIESEPPKGSQEISQNSILEIGAVAFETSRSFLVDLTLTAPTSVNQKRAAVDLVALVDTSGSMRGEKINLVQDSLEFVLSQLQSEDFFCLVEFHSAAALDFPLQQLTPRNKKLAMEAVDKLKDKGSTNMYDGLDMGLKQLQSPSNNQNVCSILVFTDGHPDTKNGIIGLIPPAFTKINSSGRNSCTVQAFGYGQDHDGNFLREVAAAGNGSYYFLEKPDDIPTSFADALGGLLSVVAQNIVLTIKSNQEGLVKKVITKFPVEQKDSITWCIKIPDLFGDESRDILVECALGSLPEPNKEQILFTSTLSYNNTLTASIYTSEPHVTSINRPIKVNEADYVVNKLVDQQRNRILCTEAIANARILGDSSKLEEARKSLDSSINQLEKSVSATEPSTIELIKDLKESLGLMKEKHTYQNVGQKKMAMTEQSHGRQRTTNMSQPQYQTSNRSQMQGMAMQAQSELSDDRYTRRSNASGNAYPSSNAYNPSNAQFPIQQKQQSISSRGSAMPQQLQQQMPQQLFQPMPLPRQPQQQQMQQQMPQQLLQPMPQSRQPQQQQTQRQTASLLLPQTIEKK